MEQYDNLVEGITSLKAQGYVEDFSLKKDCLECRNGAFKVFHDEFEIDKSFRIEGDSSAADSSILYAISSKKHDLRGILVNSYSIYSDDVTDLMLNKLK